MATGVGEENALFDCSICMEDMMERNPRLLQCHHTFCEQCLLKMLHRQRVECPTCRHITSVPAGDVTRLSINFMLVQFKEREDKMLSLGQTHCGLCGEDVSRFRCRECAISMCQNCQEKHTKMEHFKDHETFRCCPSHTEGMASHICKACTQPVCTKCIMFEHAAHQTLIVKYQDGVDEILADSKNLMSDVDKTGKFLRENRSTDIGEMEKIDQIEKSVSEKRAFHLSKVKEAETILAEIKQHNTKDRFKLLDSYSKGIDSYEEIKQMLAAEILKVKNGDVTSFQKAKQNCEEFLKRAGGLARPNVRTIPFILSEPGSETMVTRIHVPLSVDLTTEHQQDTVPTVPQAKIINRWLKEPELVRNLDIYTDIGSKYPEQVLCVGDGVAIVADRKLETLPMIDKQGKLLGHVPTLDGHGKVTGLSAAGDVLYVAQQRCITEHSLSDVTTILRSYTPNVKSIYGLLAVDTKLLIASDFYSGTVNEYRTGSNITKEVVSGLKRPSCISKDEAGSVYIVTTEGDGKLNIYNKDWRILRTISQIGSPKSCVVLLESILVADRDSHRITQLSLDGKIQEHRLCDKNGISFPVGLAYNAEYLVVLERNNPSHYRLKYFRMFE